jgi:hypothetical protein
VSVLDPIPSYNGLLEKNYNTGDVYGKTTCNPHYTAET